MLSSTLFAAFVASVVNAQSQSVGGLQSATSGVGAAASSGAANANSQSGGFQSATSGAGAAVTSGTASSVSQSGVVQSATSGVGAPAASSGPSNSTVGASGVPGGSSNSTGAYPYLNGTQAVDYLLQSLNLTEGCKNTVTTLTGNSSTEGQCLHTGVVWAAVNQNSSLLPYLDQWLEESCTSAPCSNATLTSALDQVLGNCSADFQQNNITADDVAKWFQVYPLAREIACLKTSEPFNGTLSSNVSNSTGAGAGAPTQSAVPVSSAPSGGSAQPGSATPSSSAGGAQQSGNSGAQGDQSDQGDVDNDPENSGNNNQPQQAAGVNFAAAAPSDNTGAQGDQSDQSAGTSSGANTGAEGEEDTQGAASSGVVGGSASQSAAAGQQSGTLSSISAAPTASTPSTGVSGGQIPQGNSTSPSSSTESTYCLSSLGEELSAYLGTNLTFPYLEVLALGGNQSAVEKLKGIPPQALCQECVFAAFDLISQSAPALANQVVNQTSNQTLSGWLTATCANATEQWTPSKNGTLPEGIEPTTFNSTYGFNITYYNETIGDWTTKPAANASIPIGAGSQYLNSTNSTQGGAGGIGGAQPSLSTQPAPGSSATPSGPAQPSISSDPAIASSSVPPQASPSSANTGAEGDQSDQNDTDNSPDNSGDNGGDNSGENSGDNTGAEGDQNTQGAGNNGQGQQQGGNSGENSGDNSGAEGDQNTQGAYKRFARFAAHQLRVREE